MSSGNMDSPDSLCRTKAWLCAASLCAGTAAHGRTRDRNCDRNSSLRRCGNTETGFAGRAGSEYEVSTWHDIASYVDDAIAMQNFILNLIAGVFLFVALLGITNTMLMSVLERTREIGTMMSVGVRRRQILTLFLLKHRYSDCSAESLVRWLVGHLSRTTDTKEWCFTFPGSLLPLYVFPTLKLSYILSILAIAAGAPPLPRCGRRYASRMRRSKRSRRCDMRLGTSGTAKSDTKQTANAADRACDRVWCDGDCPSARLRKWLHPQQHRSDCDVEAGSGAGLPQGIPGIR